MLPIKDLPKHEFLHKLGLRNLTHVHYQLEPSALIEKALTNEEAYMVEGGPIVAYTGNHTGRAPNDRFIVQEITTATNIDWGPVNKPIAPEQFGWILQKIQRYFKGREIYMRDCLAGADETHQIGVRVITEKAWHNLFA